MDPLPTMPAGDCPWKPVKSCRTTSKHNTITIIKCMDGNHARILLLKCPILKIQLQLIILLTVLNFNLSIGQSSQAACMSPGFHLGLITLCSSTNNYNLCSI